MLHNWHFGVKRFVDYWETHSLATGTEFFLKWAIFA
jgi:hypothetical protein